MSMLKDFTRRCLMLLLPALLAPAVWAVDAAYFAEMAAVESHFEADRSTAKLKKNWQSAIARQDALDALVCLRKAADANYLPARLLLAMLYKDGRVVEQDNKMAISLLTDVVTQSGVVPYMVALGGLYLICPDIPDHKKEAVKWFERAAWSGHELGKFYYATCLYEGSGVEKDLSKAFMWYRSAADDGNAKAEAMVAYMYDEGLGVEKDKEKAILSYRKAADMGLPDALNNLAFHYRSGDGVPENKELAFQMYKDLAEKGVSLACIDLGDCYQYGLGTEKNSAEALKWYLTAAKADVSAEVQGLIGDIYFQGNGTKKDVIEAIKWYDLGAERKSSSALHSLAMLYCKGLVIAPDAEKKVQHLLVAAEKGDVTAQVNLASCYETGRGVPQDDKKAFYWTKKAADQGHSTAAFNMGHAYRNGRGVEKDARTALEWYMKATDAEFVPAMYELGTLYYKGEGVEKDLKTAHEWFEKAAAYGDAAALSQLGHNYVYGMGVQKDPEKALQYYEKAIELGDENAMFRLGVHYIKGEMAVGEGKIMPYDKGLHYLRMVAEKGLAEAQYTLAACYHDGLGTEIDYTEAAKWFDLAARQGYPPAMYWIALMYLQKDIPGVPTVTARARAKEYLERVISVDMLGTVQYEAHVAADKVDGREGFTTIDGDERVNLSYGRTYGLFETFPIYMSYYLLGLSCEDGLFVDKEHESPEAVQARLRQAFEYYKTAAGKVDELFAKYAAQENAGNLNMARISSASIYLALSHCYEKGVGTEVSAAKAAEYRSRWEEIVGKDDRKKLNLWRYAYGICFACGLIAELPADDAPTMAESIETKLTPLCPALGSFMQFMQRCRESLRDWVGALAEE